MSGPVAVLVGPPGAGTSTVARALADRLGVPWRDTDRDLEAATGRSVGEIFLEEGESGFRERERAAALTALHEHRGVLALGGGAVMDPLIEAALLAHRVVFLDVGVADAARRIGLNRDRPAALGNPRAQWLRMMEHRRGVYERVSALTVDTDATTPEDVAARIAAWIATDDSNDSTPNQQEEQ